MKYFWVICFSAFASTLLFGQNKRICGSNIETIYVAGEKKQIIDVLYSPDSPVIYIGYVSGCSASYEPYLEKRKVDSLQTILNNLNFNNRVKEYVYSMKVYSDYTFDLDKEYKININLLQDIDGTTISGEEYRKFPQD